MKREFTISLFTEDHIGILSQITIILTRRQINIESITSSESAVKGVQLITIVDLTTEEMVVKVAKQLEKLIDVLKVFVHTSEEIIYQEIALFKVSTKALLTGNIIDHLVRSHSARFVDITSEYMVIEKSGHRDEIVKLLKELEPYGVLQYSRSGRVAITKQVRELHSYLKEMDGAVRHKEAEVFN